MKCVATLFSIGLVEENRIWLLEYRNWGERNENENTKTKHRKSLSLV